MPDLACPMVSRIPRHHPGTSTPEADLHSSKISSPRGLRRTDPARTSGYRTGARPAQYPQRFATSCRWAAARASRRRRTTAPRSGQPAGRTQGARSTSCTGGIAGGRRGGATDRRAPGDRGDDREQDTGQTSTSPTNQLRRLRCRSSSEKPATVIARLEPALKDLKEEAAASRR